MHDGDINYMGFLQKDGGDFMGTRKVFQDVDFGFCETFNIQLLQCDTFLFGSSIYLP